MEGNTLGFQGRSWGVLPPQDTLILDKPGNPGIISIQELGYLGVVGHPQDLPGNPGILSIQGSEYLGVVGH